MAVPRAFGPSEIGVDAVAECEQAVRDLCVSGLGGQLRRQGSGRSMLDGASSSSKC